MLILTRSVADTLVIGGGVLGWEPVADTPIASRWASFDPASR